MTSLTSLNEAHVKNLSEGEQKILEARHHDPFEVLGRHPDGDGIVIRAFLPGTAEAAIESRDRPLPMDRIPNTDLFEWRGKPDAVPERYALVLTDHHGRTRIRHDPYAFPPRLTDFDLHLFGEGQHRHPYRFLGARVVSVDGIRGVLFGVWAPNADRVSVVGDFNQWDGRAHPMRSRGGCGVWELFVPELEAGMLYKFELRDRNGGIHLKTDPYGRRFELRPSTAAIVEGPDDFRWKDEAWMAERASRDWQHAPLSIYEVHPGSWQRQEDGRFLNYRDLAHRLVPYVLENGFTHIELLPVTEHPFDGSWGYQATGYFAPTSRFGTPDDFRYFVNLCHESGIGVILDWVPAHFPKDDHALANFDGTPLYEHADPRRGEHQDWGTYIFNFGRKEVKAFLIASALYWLEELHLDGLRVDAVASMLYLDYSREPGEWLPNVHGGREHLEAVEFLKELNTVVYQQAPGVLTMAEESTAWPGVSRPVSEGGLGFSLKWNMGWMNDTLSYMHKDPVHRRWHHDQLTFGLMYAFSENFMLPFSHDEVVHMKRSMLEKMPGDEWQRFANLRLLYTYLFTMPGKKLLFMGNEFAQGREWNFEGPLDWHLLEHENHNGVRSLVADLNHLYRDSPALHAHDFEPEGFQWLDCDDADSSRLVFTRRGGGQEWVVALNFTPVLHSGYRLGVPVSGQWEIIFNSDSRFYGGSNAGPSGPITSRPVPAMGKEHSIEIALPPLAGVILRKVPEEPPPAR
ncbi:1,4-alpha-glucan branching enzyme [Thiohalomonas denitrificans]|uniref:1,4-alpha-glucan branching enzyme GlgB n=1 Tax=Thiohalomonas denitrificans TaxID=415747 RepID=A0A1G5Q029_9GAMM|nr:1,4-alpha-glucan branching enzyme [Thiohalomonas denitrificans]